MSRSILIYLAGPIDGISTDEARGWRDVLVPPPGVVFFSPAHAYRGAAPGTASLVSGANRQVIQWADGMLANLSGPGRGFGTICEIEYARSIGKRVVVVAPQDLQTSLETWGLSFADTPDLAVARLRALVGKTTGRRSAGSD